MHGPFLGSSSAAVGGVSVVRRFVSPPPEGARHNRFRVGQMCEMADDDALSFNSIRAKCSVDNAEGSADSGRFGEMHMTKPGSTMEHLVKFTQPHSRRSHTDAAPQEARGGNWRMTGEGGGGGTPGEPCVICSHQINVFCLRAPVD